MKGNLTRSDDAVSEVVDYSIILGIIILATGIIIVAGVPLLEDIQDDRHSENIGQSFEVLAMNMNKVVFGNAPSQSVELKMYGGALSVAGDNYMSIDIQVWNSSSNAYEIQSAVGLEIKNIENSYHSTNISYENTGVWAEYEDGGSVMISEPRFTYANNVMVIPIAKIDGRESLSGSELVSVTADGGGRRIYRYENVSQMNISITSDYFEAWGRYFNQSLEMPVVMLDKNNRTVNCSKNYLTNIDVYVIDSPMKVTID